MKATTLQERLSGSWKKEKAGNLKKDKLPPLREILMIVIIMRFFLLVALLVVPTLVSATTIHGNIIETIKTVEQSLNARVGVAVYDVDNQDKWSYHGDTPFPMMSTFKTLACAKLLADSEDGKITVNHQVRIDKDQLVRWSPVTEKHINERLSFNELCSATMEMSDNTAANLILQQIGGPVSLTQFLKDLGDEKTRLDRIEPELNEAVLGDIRDTTTPKAMVSTLNTLLYGRVLSKTSQQQLKQWMTNNKVADSLLRSVLPVNWSIADRSGAGGFGSRGITAVVWSDNRPPLVIAIYLTQTEASFDQRNLAIAKIGKAIFTAYQ